MPDTTRYAVVYGGRTVKEVAAYLPDNYRWLDTQHFPDGKLRVVIAGEDRMGWTLDDYVIPRFGSGLMRVEEFPTHELAAEACMGGMN